MNDKMSLSNKQSNPVIRNRENDTPVGYAENIISRIWKDLLRVEHLDRSSNFFQCGGHSLMILRMTTEIHEAMGINVPMALIFASPELAEFAVRIEAIRAGVEININDSDWDWGAI